MRKPGAGSNPAARRYDFIVLQVLFSTENRIFAVQQYQPYIKGEKE